MRPFAYLYPKHRKFQLLDGFWDFQEDPIDIGTKEGWHDPRNRHLFTRKIPVPSSWQAEFPDLADYAGVAWYSTDFVVESGITFSSVVLDFTAVDFRADVWVNGEYCGMHEGGYSRFSLDVTPHLSREGPNHLVVRVFDPRHHAAVPHGKQGGTWYQESSGIWGSVYLEYLREAVYINDVFVRTLDLDGGVQVDLQLKQRLDAGPGHDGAYRVRMTATSLGGSSGDDGNDTPVYTLVDDEPAILTRRTRLKTFHFTSKLVGAEYWSPNDPRLYLLEFFVFEVVDDTSGEGRVVDALSLEFGFRTVSVAGGRVLLNGKPVFLRGVLDQAFYPQTVYVPPSDDYIKMEIRYCKELGVNLNRKHIKVEDPRYLLWCDRFGLLYWEEMPNFIVPTPRAFAIFRRELEAMVVRDRNHPCVVVWGIFNEEWGVFGLRVGLWRKKLREMYRLVKEIDDSRLVVDNSGWSHVVSDLNDYHIYHIPPGSTTTWTRHLQYISEHPRVNFSRRGSWGPEEAHEKARADRGVALGPGADPPPESLPIVVSEYGTCGLPSVENIKRENHGEWPFWFLHDGQRNPVAGLCYPEGIEERAGKVLPGNLVPNLEELAKTWQWHQFLSVKFLNEEMRRLDIDGYVLTELADIEWEFNGLLDYYRNPKVFHQYFKNVNDDAMVVLRLGDHVREPGEIVRVELFLSVFREVPTDALYVNWTVVSEDFPDIEATYEVPLRTYRPYRVEGFEFQVPEVDVPSSNARVVVQVQSGEGEVVCENFEQMYVVGGRALDGANFPLLPSRVLLYDPVNAVVDPAGLGESLGAEVERVTPGTSPERGSVLLCTAHDKFVKRCVARGVKVLVTTEFTKAPGQRKYLPRFGGFFHVDVLRSFKPNIAKPKKLAGLPLWVKSIPKGENWQGMMSLHLLDAELFHPLRRSGPLFWDVAKLWPDAELTIGGWGREKPNRDLKVLGGIVYGWVNYLRGTVVHFKKLRGKACSVTVSTLKLVAHHEDPFARLILKNLLSGL
ncbi:MAG: glycoside hydrolase family 2 protein [Promethearchaeota archaeon]